jgi:hypothetical protein
VGADESSGRSPVDAPDVMDGSLARVREPENVAAELGAGSGPLIRSRRVFWEDAARPLTRSDQRRGEISFGS